MAEAQGLNVVHIESVRRVAGRVLRSHAAGRYLAIGSSAALRERVHRALAEQLGGPDRVVVVDLSACVLDPWGDVWRRANEPGAVRAGVLYVAVGLGAMARAAAEAGRPDPYGQLNFARDAWVQSGLHLWVWLDGIGAFDHFLERAPDLWSHRDYVAWFLSREDFRDRDAEKTPENDPYEPRIRAARAVLERPGVTAEERVEAAAELAGGWVEQSRPMAAWDAIQRGEQASVAVRLPIEVRSRFEVKRVETLSLVGRWGTASRVAEALLRSRPKGPAREIALREHTRAFALQMFQPELAVGPYRTLLTASPHQSDRTAAYLNLAFALSALGRITEAAKSLQALPVRNLPQQDQIRRVRGHLDFVKGDFSEALRQSESARVRLAKIGMHGFASIATRLVATVLDAWGDTDEAEALLAEPANDDPITMLTGHIARWQLCWTRGAPTTPLLTDIASLSTSLTPRWEGRAAVTNALSRMLSHLDDVCLPDDPTLSFLDTHLRAVRAAASADRKHHGDPEVEGHARWLLADVHRLRGDLVRAHALLGQDLMSWCRSWRGQAGEVALWGLLARTAPTVATAREHAQRGLEKADRSLSLFARIDARRVLAEVAARAGEIEPAVAAIQEGLTLARSEGLRLQELALLHQLAELPGHPGAASAASDALALSGALLLPRDEARALLNLVVLGRLGSGLGARRLERATEIVEALGPPRLRARVAAENLRWSGVPRPQPPGI